MKAKEPESIKIRKPKSRKKRNLHFPAFWFLCFLTFILPAWAALYEPTGIIAEVKYSHDFSLDLDKVAKLKAATTLKAEDEYSSYSLRKSLKAIYAIGDFSEVSVDAAPSDSGIVLNFILKPKLTLKEIKVSGNKVISSNDILSDLKSPSVGEYVESIVEADKKKIAELYKRRGHFNVKVESKAQVNSTLKIATLSLLIQEGEQTIVNKVEFSSNRLIDSESLLREMKTKSSQIYRPQIINEDLERLKEFYRKEGYILAQIERPVETAVPNENRINLLIKVIEGPRVNVSGNKVVDTQLIHKNISIYMDIYSDSIPPEAVDYIKNLYAKKGYYHLDIKERKRRLQNGGVEIDLIVSEGDPATIAKIDFVGNHAPFASDKNLKKQMSLKSRNPLAFSVFDHIFSKGLYDEEAIITDRRAIELFYKSHGYRKTRVEEISKDIKGYDMRLTIHISEDKKTLVNRVEIEGNKEYTKEEILPHLEVKSGKPFDDEKVSKDRAYLRSEYAQKGYLDARVEAKIAPISQTPSDSRPLRVDVTYTITEAKKVIVSDFSFEGNRYTKQEVIEREILLKRGQPLNALKLAESQQRIYGLGFFRTVKFELVNEREESEVKVVDVKWIIEEKNLGIANLGLGFGYNPSEGVRVSGEFMKNNLLGRGWKLRSLDRVGLLKGEFGNRFETMFIVPHLFGTPAHLTIRGFRGRSLEDRTDELRTGGSSTATFRSISAKGMSMVSFQYRFDDVRSVAPPFKQTTVSSSGISLLRDTKNDLLDPTKGGYHEIGVEFADGVIGKSNFIKITSDNRRFFQIIPKTSIGFALRAGYAAGLKDTKEIISFERFKSGGATIVRGYRERSLGPEDELGNNRGDVFSVFNSEFRFPIYREVGAAIFFDAGDVWGKFSDITYDSLKKVKIGSGVGLRVNTPIGPVRIDYAFPFRREGNQDKIDQFSWALGHSF